MNEVYVIFGDEKPFPGMPGSAVDRKILAVTDTEDRGSELVRRFDKIGGHYEYVDF
jgi:hypothetical protein